MKRLKKVLSLLMAMTMLIGCVAINASARGTSPFNNSTGNANQNLTIIAKQTGHNYILYQVFKGSTSTDTGTLDNPDWGVSIVNSTAGHTYDLRVAVINGLKAENLPDGTTNPLVAKFTSITTSSTAAEVIAVMKDASASELDAFATIVEDALTDSDNLTEGNTILLDNDPTETTSTEGTGNTATTNYNYAFTNISAGYYLVDETLDSTNNGTNKTYSRFILKVASLNTTVDDKSQSAPTLSKNIIETTTSQNDEGQNVTTENATRFTNTAMGDSVKFRLTGDIPDMTYYTKYFYVINDTLSKGLTYDENSMTVKIGDVTLKNEADLTTEDVRANFNNYYDLTVTPNEDGTTSLKIVIHDFVQYQSIRTTRDENGNEKPNYVVVNYNATLNDDAVVGAGASATEVNTNKANLTYSNNPNYVYSGKDETHPDEPGTDEPTGQTPEQTVYVYTTAIDLHKTNATGGSISGAVFTLTGTNLKDVKTVSNAFVPVTEMTEKAAEADAPTYMYYKADATYTETMADAVVYYQKEDGTTYTEIAPTEETRAEYADDDASKEFDVNNYTQYVVVQNYTEYVEDFSSATNASAENYTTGDFITVGSDGYIHLNGLKAGTYTLKEVVSPTGFSTVSDIVVTIAYNDPQTGHIQDGCSWTVSVDTIGGVRQDGGGHLTAQADNGRITLTVDDPASGSLPTTGGIGTTIFYVAGGTMLLAAMVLLITKRRMNHNVK